MSGKVPGDDHDLTRSLKALADAFPDARVYRDTKPEPTAARADSTALGPCTRCGGACIRYGDSGAAFCVSCRYLTVVS